MFHDMLPHPEQVMTILDPIAFRRLPPPQDRLALFKGTNHNRTPVSLPLDATLSEVDAAGTLNHPTSSPRALLSPFLSLNLRFAARYMRLTCGLVKKTFKPALQQRLDRASFAYDLEKCDLMSGDRSSPVDFFSEKFLRFEQLEWATKVQSTASPQAKPYWAEYLMTAARDCASSAWKPKVRWSEPLVTAVHECPPARLRVHWDEPLVTVVHDCPPAGPRVHWSEPLVTLQSSSQSLGDEADVDDIDHDDEREVSGEECFHHERGLDFQSEWVWWL